MVTIIDAVERKNSKNETFVSLILSGGIEFIKSQAGKFYGTTRKASIPSTLKLEHAKQIIGTKVHGMIVKKPCEAYMYKTHSGEEIELTWSYVYTDEAESLSEEIFS